VRLIADRPLRPLFLVAGVLFPLGTVVAVVGFILFLTEITWPKVFLTRALSEADGETELQFGAAAKQLDLHLVTHCERECRQQSYTSWGRLTHPGGRVLLQGTREVFLPASSSISYEDSLGRVDVETGLTYRFAWNFSYRDPGVARYELRLLAGSVEPGRSPLPRWLMWIGAVCVVLSIVLVGLVIARAAVRARPRSGG